MYIVQVVGRKETGHESYAHDRTDHRRAADGRVGGTTPGPAPGVRHPVDPHDPVQRILSDQLESQESVRLLRPHSGIRVRAVHESVRCEGLRLLVLTGHPLVRLLGGRGRASGSVRTGPPRAGAPGTRGPSSRGGCGYGALISGALRTSYWGFGGSYWGYSRFGGYSGYGGYGGGYGGYREYGSGRGASTYPDTWSPGGALGLDTGSGHIPESVRRMRGFRVIESRPMTGGADLRRIDPTLSNRSRASEQVSRESMSERVKSVAERTAAPARREVRQPSRPAASPRPVSRPLPSTRSATPRPEAGTTRSVAPARTPQERSPSAARSSTKTRPQTRPKS